MSTAAARLKENQFDMVHDSQKTFRTLMMALAFPGVIRKLEPVPLSINPPDIGYVLHPLLTLLDLETCYHVYARDKALQEEVSKYIEINTNSRAVNPEQADFILCLEPSLDERFTSLKRGTLSHPNDSATVFYLVDEISSRPQTDGVEFSLAGPGIKTEQFVSVSGMAPDDIEQWRQTRNDYPTGIDIYLVSRTGNIIGIPRSADVRKPGGN